MKVELYSLRDDKVAEYNSPVRIDNDAVAVRQFGDLVTTSKDSLISTHPEDFSLWHVGTFDTESARFSVSDNDPYIVARGSDFAKEDK